MDAIRDIIQLNDNKLILALPEYFVNKKIEVIVLPYDEPNSIIQKKKRRDAFGILKGKMIIKDNFDEPLEDFKEYQ
jgi:hypothetical protein